MNFIFISPNFPHIYSHFVKSLHDRGINVLGIGDTPSDAINQELKDNLTEYCYVSDLGNLQWMKNTIDYLEGKYGHIDYIESNNEFWLMSDSYLREYKNVQNGFWPKDMDKIKYKSKMKEYFEKAGVKTARYILVNDYENTLKFIEKVGYPVFAKPDNGVGAASTYKISNLDELNNFFATKPNEQYIMEEFINGELISFDGVCDDDSNVVLAFNEVFPLPIAEAVNKDLDVYYYAKTKIDPKFAAKGKAVVKSFGVRKRCFHIEFFKLKENRPGLARKGEILGLEVNMRSPGGDTPELLCIALGNSYYDVYADVIAYNKVNVNLDCEHFVSASVSKKDHFTYIHNNDDIYSKYGSSIIRHDFYDRALADAMGHEFYMARFSNEEEAISFAKYVQEKM